MKAEELPKHDGGLTLTHNPHRMIYQTVREYASDVGKLDNEYWVNIEQREKAFASDDVWEMQWYPDTPVGSHVLMAADLDALLDAVKSGGR